MIDRITAYRQVAMLLAIVGTYEPSRCAELKIIHVTFASTPQEYLRIDGSIALGDWPRFMREMKAHPSVVGVVLSSDGGSLDDGLSIAKQIHDRGLNTILVDACHSVCALMFLSGRARYVEHDFSLSVHTAYKRVADWTVRDHVANGAVTWFLGHMGYPLALARLWVGTEANDASSITWELNDKWQLGLETLPEQSAKEIRNQE